jgi:hypothetical protein
MNIKIPLGGIVKYGDKICEVISYVSEGVVVYMKPLKDSDKNKCEHCGKPIDTTFDVVQDCLTWKEEIKPVKTLNSDVN